MTQENAKIAGNVVKNKKTKIMHLTPVTLFIMVAFTAALGYAAGTYHYQVEAVIGPVFGYNNHSGSIDLSSLQQTYNNLAAHYDGKLDINKLIQGANSGLVAAAGDTYTVYMSPSETTSYNNTLEGNIGGGVGAVIGLKNDKITLLSVLDNNPAKSAGLLANDTVLEVNSQSTTGWTVEKAVGLVRGEEGTTVKLKIQRGSDVKDYVITRAIINNPSVISSIKGGVGTITISRFDEQTGGLAQLAAQNFKKQSVKAVILDLRDNPGGYVNSAVDVAGLWLDNQVVVTERTGNTVKETLRSGDNAILAGIPTVVLVNGSSASASEIVSGALQDHKAAKLVGEKTFGKGSVQQLITLSSGGQLKVTIARWYTPDGKNITKNGIVPDITVGLTQVNVDAGIDPQVNAAKKVLGL
jgi:carboxyl-terminal processing protease